MYHPISIADANILRRALSAPIPLTGSLSSLDRRRIDQLIARGLLVGFRPSKADRRDDLPVSDDPPLYTFAAITLMGEDCITAYDCEKEEQSKQEAKEDERRKLDRNASMAAGVISAIVGAVTGAILTLAVQHFAP